MFIEKICISGFKSYKETTIYDFSDFSEIEGRNAQGKTSIAEAIVWGLYGCDLTGDLKADSKLKNTESEDMYVIIDFYYNNQSNRIVRKKAKSLTLKFNDERISESELSKHLPNRELFLSIFNPKHFLSYSVPKQRKLFLEMLPEINPSDIFQKYNSEDITYILDQHPTTNDAIEHYTSLIKRKKSLIRDKESEINVYNNLLIEQSKTIAEVDVFTEEDEKVLNNLQGFLSTNAKNVEPISTDNLKMQISNLQTAIALEKNIEFKSSNDSYIKDLNMSLAQLSGQYSALTTMYSNLLSCESVCPTCGQPINQEHKEKELNSLMIKMNTIDSEKNALNESIDLLKRVDEENKKSFDSEKTNRINELNEEINNIRQNIKEIENSNQLLEQSFAAGIQETIAKIDNLKNKKSSYMQYQTALNSQRDLKKSYYLKIAQCRSDIEELNEVICSLELEYQKLKDYNSLYVQYIGEILSSWLNKVSINLYTVVQTTGEIKDTFEVKYDNKPLRLISNSEYIKTGLEISDMFNKSLSINLPVFVDDAESIIDIPRLDTQMLVARVKKCTLKITNTQEKVQSQAEVQSQTDILDNKIEKDEIFNNDISNQINLLQGQYKMGEQLCF